MKTRLSIIFSFALIGAVMAGMILLPCKTYAQTTEVLTVEDFEGNGDKYDPYLISSYADLCLLRDLVDSGNGLYGMYFKQTANIVFPNSNWDGIGDLLNVKAFGGYYNGNGHTISNINCNEQYAGFFSFLDGQVWNLGIESGLINGDCVGGIASHGTENARIINCYNKATVIGGYRAGGITDNFPGTIMFCQSLGEVQGSNAGASTAGITSYGAANILFCYSLKNNLLVPEGTFSGSIASSYIGTETSQEEFMEAYYSDLWEVYSYRKGEKYSFDEELEKLEKTSSNTYNSAQVRCDEKDPYYGIEIGRGTIKFMVDDVNLHFASEYEPENFALEKESNKEYFVATYSRRFNFKGSGTEEDPFQISSYDDLCLLRDCVNINVSYKDYYFVLTDDIYFPDDTKWIPAGNPIDKVAFKGTLDGTGHRLYNINSEDKYAGIFGYLDGEVRNLGIESGGFSGSTVGSIASYAGADSKIINCYNKADVVGNYRAGGISDYNAGLMVYCWNLGTVAGTRDVTTVASICSYGSADIYDCYSTGTNEVVASMTYNGAVKNVERINSKDISSIFNSLYEDYLEYIKDDLIKDNTINRMRFLTGDVSFEMNKYKSPYIFSKANFPLIILGSIGFLFAIICIRITQNGKYIKEQKSEIKENYEKVHITSKETIAVLLTIVMFTCSFGVISETLKNKNDDGITTMQNYYHQGDNIEVLFLGSSRVGVNIDGEVLWSKYGIKAYNLWGSAQPFWNSYYFLKEALDYMPPQVVVLDVTAAKYDYEYSDSYRQITNTLGIRNIFNRFRDTVASCEKKDILEFMLKMPLYHKRILSLSQNDFEHYEWSENLENDKGFHTLYGRGTFEWKRGDDVVTYSALNEKEQYYLDSIIELCKENDVNLVLVKTQILTWEAEQDTYNTIDLIAEENDIPFINFNYLDDELGFTISDFYVDGHLNTSGARKNSEFLGRYLSERYGVGSKYEDSDDAEWKYTAAQLLNHYLHVITDSKDYMLELERDNKTVIAVKYGLSEEQSELYLDLCDQMENFEYMDWDPQNKHYGDDNSETINLGTKSIKITKNYDELSLYVVGDQEVKISSPGLILIVYDDITDEIADISYFSTSKQYAISHIY